MQILTGESAGDTAQSSRVRAMARAKSKDAERDQLRYLEEAEERERAGDLAGAISSYEQAVEITEQLAQLEDEEVYVQKARSSAVQRSLSSLKREQADRDGDDTNIAPEIIIDQRSTTDDGLKVGDVTDDGWVVGETARIVSERTPEEWRDPLALEPEAEPEPADVQWEEVVMSDGTVGYVPTGRSYLTVTTTPVFVEEVKKHRWGRTTRIATPLSEMAADVPVTTAAPQGITASRWVIVVPESGLAVQVERQLVPEGVPLSVELSYKTAWKGRSGD